jgi:hypothetical protein
MNKSDEWKTFKVGSTVKRIHGQNNGMHIGDTDVITGINVDNETIDLQRYGMNHTAHYFELVGKSKSGKIPPFRYLLKYDLDRDPLELYRTLKEVEERIKKLVETERYLKRDSIFVYEIKGLPKHVKVSTNLTFSRTK